MHAKAPDNGWVAAAMGYTHAEHARWTDAMAALNVARQRVPAMTERYALDTMRLRRMSSRDGDAAGADLAQQSDLLRYFLALMSGSGLQPGLDTAYHHIARGNPDAAVKEELQDSHEAARVLRLAAASDGASREIVDRALTLPLDQGVDSNSIWAALGLALRERRDPAPYVAVIHEYHEDSADQVLEFITAARASTNPADAERLLDGLPLEARGQAYTAALVILGTRAPAEWRRGADRLLFVPERPYFSLVL